MALLLLLVVVVIVWAHGILLFVWELREVMKNIENKVDKWEHKLQDKMEDRKMGSCRTLFGKLFLQLLPIHSPLCATL